MKPHYLTPLFSPRNDAVIGASDTPGSVGRRCCQPAGGNFRQAGPVNLNHASSAALPPPVMRLIEGPIDGGGEHGVARSRPSSSWQKVSAIWRDFSDSEDVGAR
jgi:acetyltransferase